MVKETHTNGGYLLALLALPFIDNEYLSSYEPVYKFILLFIYMYFSYIVIFLLGYRFYILI